MWAVSCSLSLSSPFDMSHSRSGRRRDLQGSLKRFGRPGVARVLALSEVVALGRETLEPVGDPVVLLDLDVIPVGVVKVSGQPHSLRA